MPHAFSICSSGIKDCDFLSGALERRRAQLSAESEAERRRWMQALWTCRFSALSEDRAELEGLRGDISQVGEPLEVKLRDAAAVKAEAYAAAADAAHAQQQEAEGKLCAVRTAL